MKSTPPSTKGGTGLVRFPKSTPASTRGGTGLVLFRMVPIVVIRGQESSSLRLVITYQQVLIEHRVLKSTLKLNRPSWRKVATVSRRDWFVYNL